MSLAEGAWNFGSKAARRLASVHKPLVRMMRRRQRQQEHEEFAREALMADRSIAAIARGNGPIIAGPWLAEVGYEVLYWIPFLRWFKDAFRIDASRLTVLSRGGMESVYTEFGSYVDLFDLLTPQELAARNALRQASHERGGQKQSGISPLDEDLLDRAASRRGLSSAQVLHPSMMFRLFRHPWHGNVAMDLFWSRTRYARMTVPPTAALATVTLPANYVAVKVYSGPALSLTADTRGLVRNLVSRLAAESPVVIMATPAALDEHKDFELRGIAGAISADGWMTVRTNLGVQLSLIARSKMVLSTCGGLAWLAPFLGVPTVGVLDSDHLLAPHLLVERQAGKRVGAAEFSTLDLRALGRAGLVEALQRCTVE